MTKKEAERLCVAAAHSLELGESAIERVFADAMKWTDTSELQAAGVGPETMITSLLFGVMRVAKKHDYSFEECLVEAQEMDEQVEVAMRLLSGGRN